jgi:hypothetical protein
MTTDMLGPQQMDFVLLDEVEVEVAVVVLEDLLLPSSMIMPSPSYFFHLLIGIANCTSL